MSPLSSPVSTGQLVTDEQFDKLVARLNRLSVSNSHDAYKDIAWDDPDMAISNADPRWRLYDHDPLGVTDWYRDLSPQQQADLAIARHAEMMKIGIQFENLLQRGLLRIAWDEPNESTTYRYCHHEVIEESQHSGTRWRGTRRSSTAPMRARGWGAPACRDHHANSHRRGSPPHFVRSQMA